MTDVLAEITAAEAALERAEDAFDVIHLKHLVELAQAIAIKQGAEDAARRAGAFVLKCRRALVPLIEPQLRDPEDGRPSKASQDVTLSDFSLSRQEWQRMKLEASVDEDRFNAWIDDHISNGWGPSAAGLRRLATNSQQKRCEHPGYVTIEVCSECGRKR